MFTNDSKNGSSEHLSDCYTLKVLSGTDNNVYYIVRYILKFDFGISDIELILNWVKEPGISISGHIF